MNFLRSNVEFIYNLSCDFGSKSAYRSFQNAFCCSYIFQVSDITRLCIGDKINQVAIKIRGSQVNQSRLKFPSVVEKSPLSNIDGENKIFMKFIKYTLLP